MEQDHLKAVVAKMVAVEAGTDQVKAQVVKLVAEKVAASKEVKLWQRKEGSQAIVA